MKAIMQSITSKSDFETEVFESDADHIHFLICYPPRLSVTSIVRKLKQESYHDDIFNIFTIQGKYYHGKIHQAN